jgi:hypothetical protein
MQKDNIQRPAKGLHLDSSPQDTPKDTYRFALNSVTETELGDFAFLGNEESNAPCANFPIGYIPIGKEYMGDGRTIVFLVNSDETVSEIGIYDDTCKYETHVNDSISATKDKLGFKISKQIDATYRLRRGCERTVYWVDDFNKPRYYNFDKPQNFKNSGNGTWASSKFNLQKTYSKIPAFNKIEVLDSGGNLEPGSYNIAIQYVDESLNPTEWITTSGVVKVYNDLSNKTYREINGSINSDSDYINFPKTGKAIKVTLSDLDNDFLYYRLAIIESNNGSGQINKVLFTETIPTSKNFFIYTGNNAVAEGTKEEILQVADIIEKAGSIEQIENRLLLGNTEGKQVNFCKLQKYASRIKADCITKTVVLSDINDPSNPKNPTHEIGGLGYMPGEIYSFGIVYVFEDGSLSPTYHIPGKNPSVDASMVFSPEYITDENGNQVPITFPMVNKDDEGNILNIGQTTYNDNDSCGNSKYWGLDSEGVDLNGKFVRHHRFPLRSFIGKPLVVDKMQTDTPIEQLYYQLNLKVLGTLFVPIPCDKVANPNCVDIERPDFEVRVSYENNGESFSFVQSINPDLFSNGLVNTYDIELLQNSQYHSSNMFSNITLSITDVNGSYQAEIPVTLNTAVSTTQDDTYFDEVLFPIATYTVTVQPYTSTVQGRLFSTEILGIKFSGIDAPSLDETNGEKIIGYYIVRNERTEFDKTILDSGVLVPCVTNSKYISHGLLQPETGRISPNVYGLIHPEHKFNNKEYVNYDKIIQQGNFNLIDRKLGKVNYDDVYDGTSFNKDKQSKDNDDGHSPDGSPTERGLDGWSFNMISRDNIVSYKQKTSFEIESSNINDRFYLDALGNKSINDNANDVYNIACDNKVGIIELKSGTTLPANNNLPYVLLYKENTDPYSNFRVLPYYKENLNAFYFDANNTTPDSCSVFNGDSYVTPMKYVNTMYYDNRVARRSGKKSILKIVLGAAIVVFGILVNIIPIIGQVGSALAIGAGVALIGAGALFVSSGIKQGNFNRAYNEEYDKGLRQTTLDSWVDAFYNYRNNGYTNGGSGFGFKGNGESGQDGPSDDTIQWLGDCVTDLWFESNINMSLRNHFVDDASPTYLDAPGRIESGNNSVINTWEFFGINYSNSNSQRYPISSLERHLIRKVLAFDQKRDDNKYYIGIALGEYYNVNPDYLRKNKEKIYYHLPLEYDCCSECKEDFPHRVHYSEQSYQEELSDNYRIFLPNNYRDLEGETGQITNLFRLGNDLFVHTKEALWQMPRSYQERVTDQIVSFIGTGSYFEIPPRKVLDDDTGASAGCQHKWSSIKTPNGYFFMTENQRNFYRFNGSTLEPVSSQGLYNWFFNNAPVKVDEQYYKANYKLYPFKDNPSNYIGTGFITTYDPQKERILLTKKDFILPDLGNGYELCTNGSSTVIFPNINDTIAYYNNLGWNYVGIDSCRLKFEKTTTKTKTEIRNIVVKLPNTADIIVWLDTSGSFDEPARQVIKDAVGYYDTNGNPTPSNSWLASFASSNPDWTGNLHYLELANQAESERWLHSLEVAKNNIYGGNIDGKNIIMVSFVNEAHDTNIGDYHTNNFDGDIDLPTGAYMTDYNNFINIHDNEIVANGGSFYGLSYPIVFAGQQVTEEFLKHVLAAVNGIPFTSFQADNLLPNPGVGNWNLMKSALQTTNDYPDNGVGGLNQQGWQVITNRFWNGSGQVITAEQFQEDMNEFLLGITTVEQIEVTVDYLETEYLYIDGEVLENPIEANTSWTLSYSLKQGSWTSWHSYLPRFYINTPSKIFSWTPTPSNSVWKHNIKGNYQTYYGAYKPHIIEYVSLSTPVVTRIWNHLRLLTEAKKLDIDTQEYFDVRFATFNKAILYNSRQCSGLLDLVVKDTTLDQQNYLMEQVINSNNNSSIIDKTEVDWLINDFRDMRIDYTKPIWNSNIYSLQNEYFIDKILNSSTIDINKDWTQLESFRDKYLVVRLIFDNFADVKLITNYSVENEQQSLY